MRAAGEATDQPMLAPVENDRDSRGYAVHRAHRAQCSRDLAQPGNGVETGDKNNLAGRQQLPGPAEPGHRQVEQHQIVARRNDPKQSLQGVEAEIDGRVLAPRRGQHVEPAAVVADEQTEQLIVEPLRIRRDLPDLHARLNVEIIADMAVLEIHVEQADAAAAGLLGVLELNGDLDGESAVADAAGAGHERHHHRLRRRRLRNLASALLHPAQDLGDLVGRIARGGPVGATGLHQALVVAGRDIVADEDEEQAIAVFTGDRHHAVERLPRAQHHREQHAGQSAVAASRRR